MARPRKTAWNATRIYDDCFRKELRVRQAMLDLMTQRELSKACGIPASTMCKRLSEVGDFSIAELRKLVEAIEPDPLVMLATLGYSDKAIARLKRQIRKSECASGGESLLQAAIE